ncbi:MAG TPA: hypothetical protein PLQ13_03180, partial [Candidatus Krumholzibacteria bacterium]|nr:hypothetical protein [Candidatus Krumholzibacteria bacterium]
HHGSDTSGSQAFLEAATPGAVIVSCGVDNRYRHPSHGPWTVGRDTLGVVRTDLQGTVTVSWKGGEARIRAGRSGPP